MDRDNKISVQAIFLMVNNAWELRIMVWAINGCLHYMECLQCETQQEIFCYNNEVEMMIFRHSYSKYVDYSNFLLMNIYGKHASAGMMKGRYVYWIVRVHTHTHTHTHTHIQMYTRKHIHNTHTHTHTHMHKHTHTQSTGSILFLVDCPKASNK